MGRWWTCARNIGEQYRTISEGKEKLELWQSQVLDLEQQLDALNEDLLACTDRVRRQQAEQRKTKAALEELECYLARPEIQALARKLEELNAALDRAQKQYHETDTQIQLRQNDLDHQGPELTRKKQDLQKAIGEEETLRQIFEEELCRGPGQPGRGEEPLWRQAETARDRIRQKDRNLGPEDLRTSLEKNMRIASTLNAYRIGIPPLFASEEGRLRSRVCIELYLDGQRLDLLDFIRRLEDQREAEEQLLSREDRRLFEDDSQPDDHHQAEPSHQQQPGMDPEDERHYGTTEHFHGIAVQPCVEGKARRPAEGAGHGGTAQAAAQGPRP